MNVLQLNVSEGGCTGNFMQGIHRRLTNGGHTSKILFGRGGKGSLQSAFSLCQTALFTRASGQAGHFAKAATNKVLAEINAFSPDVVHLHNLHGYYVDIFLLLEFLKQQNIPTVITLHDEFLFTGRCGFSLSCEKWKTGCGNCPQLREYPAVWVDKTAQLWEEKRKLFNGFSNLCFVSPSNWLCERAKESFLKEHPVSVIPNGVETSVFCPGESTLRAEFQIEQPYVVMCAAQTFRGTRKGMNTVAQLAKIMPNTFFLVVGANKEERTRNVLYLKPNKTQTEMINYYRGADCFLSAAQFDNFPTVCLESSACGTPVAGFSVGGVPETVPKEISSFVSFGDIEGLKKAMYGLFTKKDKTRNASFVRNNAEEMYRQYLEKYMNISKN